MTKHGTKAERDPSRMFDAMDLYHDGYLDKAEITTMLTKRFHRMDWNGDGIVTPHGKIAAHLMPAWKAPIDAATKSQP